MKPRSFAVQVIGGALALLVEGAILSFAKTSCGLLKQPRDPPTDPRPASLVELGYRVIAIPRPSTSLMVRRESGRRTGSDKAGVGLWRVCLVVDQRCWTTPRVGRSDDAGTDFGNFQGVVSEYSAEPVPGTGAGMRHGTIGL